MSFREIQFPPNYLVTGFSWTPEFHTTVVTLGGGYEQRNKDWAVARGHGSANLRLIETDKDTVLSFFYNVGGGFDGFRAKIWADYTGTDQLLGTVDGGTMAYQITKTYTTGSLSYVRNIYKPVASPAVTMKEGTTLGSAVAFTNFTYSTSTGIIQMLSLPTTGHNLWVTYQFDTPVKMTDDLSVSLISPQASGNLYDVRFDFFEIREVS